MAVLISARRLDQAYAHCLALARSHYENFPVASWLLPRRLRYPIAAIYTFARTADDLADEGERPPHVRLAGLQNLAAQLHAIEAGKQPQDDLGIALADSIARHHLPLQPFHDLLSAFSQDVIQKRYADFGQVMDYCRRSANPIGRLLLHLLNRSDAHDLACSDAICSALQLINFYQDLAQDYLENDRIYIPVDEMLRFNVSENQFRNRQTDPPMQQLMQFNYQRAERLLRAGAPLAKRLPGRIGWELRLTVLGGLRILYQLKRSTNDVFARPRLGLGDGLSIAWHAMRGQ